MPVNITIISSTNKKVAQVHFSSPGQEQDYTDVCVSIRNIIDIRLPKAGDAGLVGIHTPIGIYDMHYSLVSSVDGVDPQSNLELFTELQKMLIASWD